jgi:ABC-type multidrug transport system ATPase subunit
MVVELSAELRVTGLRKSFGSRTVLNLDFTLEPGGFCLILGENGAGKSTFFRCLLGLENYQGSVRVGGGRPNGAIVGVLDQPTMYAGWTAAQNMRYLLNDSKAPALPVVERLVERDLLRRKVGKMSTGQKKMVLLATALASDSPIVLLDEFANGLDRNARSRFREVVRDQMQRHRSFIATGHDLLAFDGLPTNVMVMQGGTLIDITGEYKARQDIEGIYEEYVARTDP